MSLNSMLSSISQFDSRDVSFIMVASAMVSFMTPGIGILEKFGLMNVLGGPSPGSPLVPDLLYAFYQMEFACAAVGILVGGIGERGRVLPAMVFTFVWLTLTSDIFCHAQGGGPVEIANGVGGLAYALVLGHRQDKEFQKVRLHSFNDGSAFGANMRAVMVMFNSILSAAAGGIVWCALDYRLQHKFSMVGFCSGTISGLIVATPASGYIQPWAAVLTGVITSASNSASGCTVDDSFDLFTQHAIGGILGLLTNAFFVSHSVIALDGINTNVPGGWVDHNWKRLYVQVTYIMATCSYAFIVTFLIAHFNNIISGLHLRATAEGEMLGLDEVEVSLDTPLNLPSITRAQIGEFATDYIEVFREVMEQNTVQMCQRESTLDTIVVMPNTVAAADNRSRKP
ncbi:hypothetical protein AZE42_09344 [Rhizopogon vesiculosus]|uniref:Ammonium transporter AmtB-like domain-containing protein n=1 Tax=Rhizopogon vesiculosus TaxID=180088 RepID=A0A1J8QY38_9AGAM|nr:hypothetical protein AZE42_09344 [Rhizopogon vesiculosus]